jgi:hypothetical protein
MIETSERTDAGCPGGEGLGDHPAHRGADQVRRLEPELAQQTAGVLRHVAEPVENRVDPPAPQLAS